MGELDGKVAMVTGAGRLRGIGRAMCVALAKRGADVVPVGTGRSPEAYPPDEQAAGWRDIESTAEQVRALGRRALPLVGDVSSSGDVDRMVQATLAEFGRVDILVNNAAFRRGEDRVSIDQLDEDVWRRVLEVKATGTFLLTKAVGSVLIRQGQGGSIVNMSSVAGKRASPITAAYSAANAAVQNFTQAAAQWLAPYGVNVNCVCPGVTDTSRMDDLGYPRAERWQALVSQVPMKRAASDEEMAEVMAWLCTPGANYVTGQSINVDGGFLMWAGW